MEPSKEPIAVRITRLNRQILGKITGGATKFSKKTIDREALLDALTVLYDECNDDPVKRTDELVKAFVDKYRSTLAELRRTRVCISDFEMLQTIGRGHFGEVHMVREKQTGDVYALKTLRKEQSRKRAADDERDVLANATGTWIPKLQYAFQDSNNLYLVMELCSGGDLAGLLSRRSQPLPEREAAFYVAEVAHALKALHGMGYVHRDVKPHNILLDRCGHVKLGDFGSSARLSEGGCSGAVPATADYMAPELLAAADCATHTVCVDYCARLVTTAISSCDYWSLGVIAFELVTLRRPFSRGDEDSIPQILSNIQKYERESSPALPWDEGEAAGRAGASGSWRALVGGLLRVPAARRYSYLDTLQHAALAHLPAHNIRDQAPPWVPLVRGAEDATFFSPPPRVAPPPSATPFRTRPPFAGQLPFVGYSYVAPEETEESTGGFNASHDCTAIDLATFKSAEKLAAMRSREIAALQTKLAEAEALVSTSVERTRQEAEAEAERMRARLQAEITALTLQNKRLERQVEVEKEERMALQRTNQELTTGIAERNSAEVRNAKSAAASLRDERDALRDDLRRLQAKCDSLQADCSRALAEADSAKSQQQHYKDIVEHVQELRHRRLTELNVRAIDTIAKERAIRRQTLSGGEAESREAASRIAAAEANASKELRARQQAEKQLAKVEDENHVLREEVEDLKRQLITTQERLDDKQRMATTSSEQLQELQTELAQERVRASTLLAQVQELERGVQEAARREAAVEEQCARTEARLGARLAAADLRAAAALHDDARHREKVRALSYLTALYRVQEAARREAAVEEQCARTEARLGARLAAADLRAAAALHDDARHREKVRALSYLTALYRVQEAARREAAVEEQCARTEARLGARLAAADLRAAAALHDDARHREKVRALSYLTALYRVQEAARREAAVEEQCARTEARLGARLAAADLRAAAALHDDARHREKVRALSYLTALYRVQEAARREAAVEEQCARTEARLGARLAAADLRAAAALHDDARHREKVRALSYLTALYRVQEAARREAAVEEQCARTEARLGARLAAADLRAAAALHDDARHREKVRALSYLTALYRVQEAARREAAVEEQCARTEARLGARLAAADLRAAAALHDDARHREKVNTLEQLVRQLEREVSALEKRSCMTCALKAAQPESEQNVSQNSSFHEPASAPTSAPTSARGVKKEAHSDTESLGDANAQQAQAQIALLKEQLERAEAQLQARAEELATLRQETRAANLARWRKEREYNELSVESKSTARDLKRAEERLATAIEARKSAEQKATELHTELVALRPKYEHASGEASRLREQLDKLTKSHDVLQAEVDRSRNDIRKLKSELQYSEKRRLHAEEQEELSSRERAQLRDELSEVRRNNAELIQNNKALQEACSMLEEQLTDLEKLADIHELKNKDLEGQLQGVRVELATCRARLTEAEQHATERGVAASRALAQHDEARDQARHAHCELQLLRERLEARETRVAELEARAAALESSRAAADAALSSAARRVRDLQEECAALRTRAHQHHAHALQLQASLADAQEELSAAREASSAAAAWWRTRETKADATLRQQAKLIDFLQAKVEEASRKKCSLSNKLFGRSGRRPAASPPLRRANRELREEVERLRAKLATFNGAENSDYPPTTPRREKSKTLNGSKKSIDMPDSPPDQTLLIVWPDDSRERMRARAVDDVLVLTSGQRELRARLLSADVKHLPHNEANRAFAIRVEGSPGRSEAAVVCSSVAERAGWVAALVPAPAAAQYVPAPLAQHRAEPLAALYVAPNVAAIGSAEGLHSLRGAVRLEWEGEGSPTRGGAAGEAARVWGAAAAGGRAVLAVGGALAHCGRLALASALRRAAQLRPVLAVAPLRLPDDSPPHLVKALVGTGGDTIEGPSVAVACGRRVFLLYFDASSSEFRVARSITVDRAPCSLLLTSTCLFIAGEKPLKINLPSGALETFGMDEPTVAAAARKRSPPRAFLLIQAEPLEILICYAECGIFVDENGKRTRTEDPKWSTEVYSWQFVKPFLYVIGDDKITIVYLNEEAYRAPPCTCDVTSLASSNSDCYLPEIFNLKVKEPALLGTAPQGIIIRSKIDDGYIVSIVEGTAAFRSIGASVESLATLSDMKGYSFDLSQSTSDLAMPQDVSQESVEVTTGFLADIRKRARQLRNKHRKEPTPDDVIKEILTTEVEMKRSTNVRKSPATISEFDSDSDSGESEENNKIYSTNPAADLCAEMFTRQVRFQ